MITREQIVIQWIKVAERNLLAAAQALEANPMLTKEVGYNCREAVEKFLKAFLVKSQIKFEKNEELIKLLNLCSQVDNSFKEKLSNLFLIYGGERTDDAVEGYERSTAEAKNAYAVALEVKKFILEKLEVQ